MLVPCLSPGRSVTFKFIPNEGGVDQNHQADRGRCNDEKNDEQLMQDRALSQRGEVDHRRDCDEGCSQSGPQSGRVDPFVKAVKAQQP